MASRILLLSTNRCSTPEPVFPIGLAYLNAALRRAGHATRWLDCQADPGPLAAMLAGFQPDFVGVSVRNVDDVLIRRRETYFGDLGAICADVRKAVRAPIILGGSGYSIFPEKMLDLSGADYGIQGEGEAALPALIAALTQGGDATSVPGLVYRRGRGIARNPPRPSGALPALEAGDRPERLVAHYLGASGMLNLQTQRGCAQGCCYCTYPLIEGRAHRRHAPETVADEMAQLEAQGAKYVFVVDSVFNSSTQHVAETCEAILRRKVGLRWGCFLRPQGLTPDLVQLMARAGLAHIEFGSDSFCDAVLAAYGKGLTFDDIRRSSELARRAGIDYCHYLICGGPGETMDTLQAGFQNSLCLDGAVILAVVGMRVYPGTRLQQLAVREGQLRADADLLPPAYYVGPGLTAEDVFASLRQFAEAAPNWIVGDPTPAYAQLARRLRQRGVVGPLWSYFSMIQRLWPTPDALARP